MTSSDTPPPTSVPGVSRRTRRRQRRPAAVPQQALHPGRQLQRPGGAHRQRRAAPRSGRRRGAPPRARSRRRPTSTSVRKPTRPTSTPSTGQSAALRHPHAAQERAVAAEGDEQVEVPGALGLVVRRCAGARRRPRRRCPPRSTSWASHQLPHHRRRLDGGRPATVHDDADPVQRAVLVAHPCLLPQSQDTTTTAATSARPGAREHRLQLADHGGQRGAFVRRARPGRRRAQRERRRRCPPAGPRTPAGRRR